MLYSNFVQMPPADFSSFITVDGVVYGRYVTDSDEDLFLSVYNLAKYDIGENQLTVIARETPDISAKFFKDGLIYLTDCFENQIYTFDVENEVMKKLPFRLYDTFCYQYRIEKIELLGDSLIKTYAVREDKKNYYKEEPVIYLFNTQTGRKLKVEL